jgi:serine protease Do
VETVEKETFESDGEVKKKKVRKFSDGVVSQITFQGAESVSTSTYRTSLEKIDKDVDLALLKIKADIPNTQAVKVACEAPRRGDHVYVVGNPMGILYSSVVDGLISSTQRDYEMLGLPGTQAKKPLTQVSGGIIGGNSGGAVYSDAGDLVGVPVLGHRVNETIGFAVPLSSIREFLGDKVEKCDGK